MDDVLPIPTPDWDNPHPYDGPVPEETEMFRQLQAAADGIRAWVTCAYVKGTSPDAWKDLGDRIVAVGQKCVDLTCTVEGGEQ